MVAGSNGDSVAEDPRTEIPTGRYGASKFVGSFSFGGDDMYANSTSFSPYSVRATEYDAHALVSTIAVVSLWSPYTPGCR